MSTDAQLIALLNNISTQMSRYATIITYLFGSIGNGLNILIFAQKEFRTRPCSIYFLFSSIANLSAILAGLTSRMLNGWAADLTNTDRFVCKFRTFILNVARPIALWLILLAAIDRWLLSHSNVRYRQLSTVPNAIKSIITVTIIFTLIFSHILYCYEPNMVNSPLQCYGKDPSCRMISAVLFAMLSALIPQLLMLIFGLMTIRNVQQSRARVQCASTHNGRVQPARETTQRSRLHKIDYHLLVMLLVQILFLCVLGLPLGVDKLYEAATMSRPTTKLELTINNFIYNVVLIMNFLCNGVPFYIYTLVGGKDFRRAVSKLVSSLGQKLFRLPKLCHR